MKDKVRRLFSEGCGGGIYSSAVAFMREHGMVEKIKSGTLVGLSGGADSVMLLLLLLEYREREGNFPILALHLNHSIRGDEADRDEEFSRSLCEALSVEFISVKKDIPMLARERGVGTEECARDVRYGEFSRIVSEREDISTIAVAHNADDNMETVLLNLLRGAGARGASGIPPVRDNIVRPLLPVSKEDIVFALGEAEISFVTDSTNLESDYSRNFIRNEITPRLRRLKERPEESFLRLSENLRSDDGCLNELAQRFSSENDTITCEALLSLHKAVRFRVLKIMSEISLSFELCEKISSLLTKKDFRYSLGGGKVFVAERGVCRVDAENTEMPDFEYRVSMGLNEIEELSAIFLLSYEKPDNSFSNVYNYSIHANLSSVIIDGDLYLRSRRDGDTIRYGKMTRKIKTLYSDAKIPRSKRQLLPLLCDNNGVVWAPGFGVREDRPRTDAAAPLYAQISVSPKGNATPVRMYLACEFKDKVLK